MEHSTGWRGNICVLEGPSQSPDLNPIENLGYDLDSGTHPTWSWSMFALNG